MPKACVVGSRMEGSVPHHAGHIIGWTGGEFPQPIYCSGHNVTGQTDQPGQSKLFIQSRSALVKGGSGTTTDPCDGSRFQVATASRSMFVQGKAVVREGDGVSINPGSGKMSIANQNKFNVRR